MYWVRVQAIHCLCCCVVQLIFRHILSCSGLLRCVMTGRLKYTLWGENCAEYILKGISLITLNIIIWGILCNIIKIYSLQKEKHFKYLCWCENYRNSLTTQLLAFSSSKWKTVSRRRHLKTKITKKNLGPTRFCSSPHWDKMYEVCHG